MNTLFKIIFLINLIYTYSFINENNINNNIKKYNNKIECFKNINYTHTSLINKNCNDFYNKYVLSTQSSNNQTVSFAEYLEYWWNQEETEEELLNRVCKLIYNKYPINHLRKSIF
jgi:hypothetical protein